MIAEMEHATPDGIVDSFLAVRFGDAEAGMPMTKQTPLVEG